MIITKIIGGLGNQMFQYAAARRLAYIHKTDLKLDISSYQSYRLRDFQLKNFKIKAMVATNEEIKSFIQVPSNIVDKALFLLFPFFQKKSKNHYEETFYHFDPNVLRLPDNTYLSGYFHSEKYFIDIINIIRKELVLKIRLGKKNLNILKKIRSTNSTSIHVRRGDFATNPSTRSLHGLYELDYLKRAVSIIKNKVYLPHFYVFSDDIRWAIKNLKIGYPIVYVSNSSGRGECKDLQLMSSCKHNIIVNSTFGWWGAWLNKNENKMVITPKKWYNNDPVDTYDLIPESWTKI